MKLTDRIMEKTFAYRLWQAPFVEEKFSPILAHNDLSQVRRVLDVGCGPGTNAHRFDRTEYMGIDWNPDYIEYARRRYKGKFVVADVTTYKVPPEEKFDFILVNSFFHHVDSDSTQRILKHLCELLTDDGHIHILDLVMPSGPWIARFLARMDRGKFPRPRQDLVRLAQDVLETSRVEPFNLTALGATLWNFVYIKGKPPR
jgi:SAM-dependent methyltransferase